MKIAKYEIIDIAMFVITSFKIYSLSQNFWYYL